jgi:hypothetical protein
MLAALLSALAVTGGQPAEPVCHGQVPVREGRPAGPLASAIRYRRSFGFRTDRAYVRRVQRRGRMDRELGIAFTRREWRYLRMRGRIEHSGGRVRAYLRRHADLSGGESIEDDWPRGPYLLVRLTRDQALHEAALKRIYRYPDNLRTVAVQHSERELRHVQDSIDFDAHGADGFFLVSTSVDIDLNRVVVGLITGRTDHAAYFAQRYGPLVVTRVIATERTRLECRRSVGYRLSRSGRSLRVLYFSGGGARFERLELDEGRRRVAVGVVEDVPNGPRTSDLRYESRVVRLQRAFGDRVVIDAATGRPLRRVRCAKLLDCFETLQRRELTPPR